MCFQTVRTNATLTSYAKIMDSQIPTPNNATVSKTGFNGADHMHGRFPHGKLPTVHLPHVRAEILHGGGEFDPKMKIRKLGKCLLALEINQSKTYKERSDIDSRDKDPNTTTFKQWCGTPEPNALL